jgi:hypothetical protein
VTRCDFECFRCSPIELVLRQRNDDYQVRRAVELSLQGDRVVVRASS